MSLTHPNINRLPTEMFTNIFKHASETSKTRTFPHIGWRGPGPIELKVALVCRRWRAIALEIPTLWTYIYISDRTSIDAARLFVERSQSKPLHFIVNLTVESTSDKEQQSERCHFTELLLSCAGRWKHLSIEIREGSESDGDISSLASIILSRFTNVWAPLLESFTIACKAYDSMFNYYEDTVYFWPPVSLFQLGSPRLTRVKYVGIGPDICQTPSSILTSCAIQTTPQRRYAINLFELFACLKQLPALVHVSLEHGLVHVPPNVPSEYVVDFPDLLSLHLEPGPLFTFEYLFTTLGAISAANLKHFSLSWERYFTWDSPLFNLRDNEIWHNILAEYADPHRFPLLESLDLHIPSLPHRLMPIFEWFPTITSVSLGRLNSRDMMRVMANDRQILLWPEVDHLILENWDHMHEAVLLSKLLWRRMQSNSPIRRLTLRRSTLRTKLRKLPELLLRKLRRVVDVEVETHRDTYCRYGYGQEELMYEVY